MGRAPDTSPVRHIIERLEIPSQRSIGKALGNVWQGIITVLNMPPELQPMYWELLAKIVRVHWGLVPFEQIASPYIRQLAQFLWVQFLQAPDGVKFGKSTPTWAIRDIWTDGVMPTRQQVGSYAGNMWLDAASVLQMDKTHQQEFFALVSTALREAWGLPQFEDIEDVPLKNLARFLWERSLRTRDGTLRVGPVAPQQAPTTWATRKIMETGQRLSKRAMSHGNPLKEAETVFELSGDDLAEYRRLVEKFIARVP